MQLHSSFLLLHGFFIPHRPSILEKNDIQPTTTLVHTRVEFLRLLFVKVMIIKHMEESSDADFPCVS